MTNFSAERLWEVDRALPQQVQIAVNINMLDIGQRSDGTLEAPFVFTVSFTPPIAQISIKGKAKISGDSEDTKKIIEEHNAKKPPPAQLIQAVSNAAIADAILLSRSLNIPPPLPPIPQPQAQAGTQKQPDSRYTVIQKIGEFHNTPKKWRPTEFSPRDSYPNNWLGLVADLQIARSS